tara:strand:+ start:127 stop:300 length:174 start_codon:yes stop_codon:yes gene_type:complete
MTTQELTVRCICGGEVSLRLGSCKKCNVQSIKCNLEIEVGFEEHNGFQIIKKLEKGG